jgi:hypothetical protein
MIEVYKEYDPLTRCKLWCARHYFTGICSMNESRIEAISKCISRVRAEYPGAYNHFATK